MSEDLDILLKTDNDKSTVSLNNSIQYNYTKKEINNICNEFCNRTREYNPEKTVKSIKCYLSTEEKMERILYSEISSFIFSLDLSQRGVFATNVEKLLLYVLNSENDVGEDCRKLVIKIYDHFHLALNQIENVNNILGNSIEETKINLQKDIKDIEKDYISIFGIFASIVLTFVAGITFSSSVLQNIGNVSIYRLLLTIDLLGMILVNIFYMLFKFVCIINNKPYKELGIKSLNIIFIVFKV